MIVGCRVHLTIHVLMKSTIASLLDLVGVSKSNVGELDWKRSGSWRTCPPGRFCTSECWQFAFRGGNSVHDRHAHGCQEGEKEETKGELHCNCLVTKVVTWNSIVVSESTFTSEGKTGEVLQLLVQQQPQQPQPWLYVT